MEPKSSDNSFIPALLAVCAILIITVCLLAAVPRVFGDADDAGTPALATTSAQAEENTASTEATDTAAPEEAALKLPHLIFPLDGRITSGFAWRDDPFFDGSEGGEAETEFHRGIDISAARSRDIRACAGGVVCFAGYSRGYGNYLMIDHGDYVSLYAHCSELLVSEGDEIAAGDSIAIAGATGRATGPHLHFEIRVGGQVVDPLDYVGSVYAGVPN